MLVSRYDQARATVHRKLKKPIIVRIRLDYVKMRRRLDQFGRSSDGPEHPMDGVLCHAKLGPAQDLDEFLQDIRRAQQDISSVNTSLEELPRSSRSNHGANENVRVQDQADGRSPCRSLLATPCLHFLCHFKEGRKTCWSMTTDPTSAN